tara:strand:+ start:291 stop:1229 length:939 start_codon:yes stop_codon:yes gene_type:complete
MTVTENWVKYTRDEKNTTKYFYNKTQEKYSSEIKNSLYDNPLTTFNVGEENSYFDFNDEYMEKFNRVKELSNYSIHKGNEQGSINPYAIQWQPHEKTHDKTNELNEAVDDLLGMVLPMVEKEFYNSKISCIYSLIYYSYVRPQPDPDNRTTWQWHLDNYPKETYKIIFYNTDVTETTAPFTYLVDENDNPVYMDSHAEWVGPKDNEARKQLFGEVPNEWKDDRIPSWWINQQLERGYKEKMWTAKAGSFCLFSPNVAHKATVPYTDPREVISFTFRPSFRNDERRWSDSLAMNGEHNLHDWYDGEDIDETTW